MWVLCLLVTLFLSVSFRALPCRQHNPPGSVSRKSVVYWKIKSLSRLQNLWESGEPGLDATYAGTKQPSGTCLTTAWSHSHWSMLLMCHSVSTSDPFGCLKPCHRCSEGMKFLSHQYCQKIWFSCLQLLLHVVCFLPLELLPLVSLSASV